ncbi:GyrI-like domain-containing protein [Clostridium sp. 001]|uniref:GyrI-like domain-containing protein n=1 Tax=Clostridium sp. 001 TaxID=1970093 RepID=UPI001C2BE06B|nr:GyrI-like domain-containing protein [Clostridium sp. 001]QXE18014.1 transcriptional regulator [Clostridium sp. 001]
MDYRIEELDAFSVIGQEIELTNYQNKNIKICTEFWKQFNCNLKKAYLSQYANWIKYAFMEKRNETLFYHCAVPKKLTIPENFILREVEPQKYLVFEHTGSMDKIYKTYAKIYKDILPNNKYILVQNNFLHFEKYDYRFHWNNEKSIIEIWIPIQN